MGFFASVVAPFHRAPSTLQSRFVKLDDEQRAMLDQATAKAQRLLDELVAQQAELDANPPKIPQADLAAGKQAFDNAVAAARRTLAALEGAAALPAD